MERFYNNSLLKHSIKTMFSNKIRFLLTLVGVIVGVTLFTFTILNFDNNYRTICKKYEQFGEDTIVLKGQFSFDDFHNISEWENVENIVYYNKFLQANPYKTKGFSFYITGVSENFLKMPIPDANAGSYVYYSNLLYGRTFTEEELLGLSNGAIINESTSLLFFGKRDAVGEKITVTINNENVNFYIVGIIQDSFIGLKQFDTYYKKMVKNEDVSNNIALNLYIPQMIYDSYQKGISDIEKIVITDSNLDVEELNGFIFKYFKKAKLVDINTSDLVRQEHNNEFNSFKNIYLFLSVIFALFSCLILIVIMLFSIKERVYEIGLKKALGAKNIDIVFQFMSEFIVVGFLGSLIGVLLGIFAFSLNNIFTSQGVLCYYVFPSYYAIIAPFFIMLAFITIFSVIPAIIAGKVNIIDAIRFE